MLSAGTRDAAARDVVGTLLSGPTMGDAMSVYWNPAAMTLMTGSNLLVYAGISFVGVEYARDTPSAFDGSRYPRAAMLGYKPGPAIGFVTEAGLRDFRFGVAFAVPNIFGGQWSAETDGRPASTRYYGMRVVVADLYFELAAAWRINRYIAIGVGLDIIAAYLEHSAMTDMGARLNQVACTAGGGSGSGCQVDAPLARENPAFDALTEAKGLGVGVGGVFSVLVTPTRWLRFGLTVHTGAGTISVPFDLTVQMPAAISRFVRDNNLPVALPPISASGDFKLASPTHVIAGVAVRVTDKLDLAADFRWRDESRTSVMAAQIERTSNALLGGVTSYKPQTDVFRYAASAAYRFMPSWLAAARFEYGANTRAAEQSTPINVDTTKLLIYLGVMWRVTERVTLSLEYGHFFLIGSSINRSRFAPNANAITPQEQFFDKPPPTGAYSGAGNHVGLGFQLHLP